VKKKIEPLLRAEIERNPQLSDADLRIGKSVGRKVRILAESLEQDDREASRRICRRPLGTTRDARDLI
jgi:hypothetical protein